MAAISRGSPRLPQRLTQRRLSRRRISQRQRMSQWQISPRQISRQRVSRRRFSAAVPSAEVLLSPADLSAAVSAAVLSPEDLSMVLSAKSSLSAVLSAVLSAGGALRGYYGGKSLPGVLFSHRFILGRIVRFSYGDSLLGVLSGVSRRRFSCLSEDISSLWGLSEEVLFSGANFSAEDLWVVNLRGEDLSCGSLSEEDLLAVELPARISQRQIFRRQRISRHSAYAGRCSRQTPHAIMEYHSFGTPRSC